MTAVQPSKVDMCRLLSDQPVGAIEYIYKEVNVKEFDWDYWQLHRCEKTTLLSCSILLSLDLKFQSAGPKKYVDVFCRNFALLFIC